MDQVLCTPDDLCFVSHLWNIHVFLLIDFLLMPHWWHGAYLWWRDDEYSVANSVIMPDLMLLLFLIVLIYYLGFVLMIQYATYCWASLMFSRLILRVFICCFSWFELMMHYVDGWWAWWWCGYICFYYSNVFVSLMHMQRMMIVVSGCYELASGSSLLGRW